MDKLDLQEKIWGGVFGVIAIIAAIGEMLVNGINKASVLGAIKDVAGTLVMVVLLVVVIKSLMPKKYALSFEERLTNALVKWQKDNANMIVKTDRSDGNDFYGLSMKTDITSFFTPTPENANADWFVRLPKILEENYNKQKINILFNLNRGTFFEKRNDLTVEQKNEQLSNLSRHLSSYMIKNFGDMISGISKSGKDNITLSVTLKDPIVTDEGITRLIDLINGMYQGYLVAANIDLSK